VEREATLPGPIPRKTSGSPPRTRARLFGAHVVAAPAVLEISKSTGYAGVLDVSLGAEPLRGAAHLRRPYLDDSFSSTRVEEPK